MIKKKTIKITAIVIGIIGISIGAYVYYLINMPHRDVQGTKTDYSLSASNIVNEYLNDQFKANEKYLDEEGESKVLEVKGVVSDISEDFNHQVVILLKNENDNAGVSCTLLPESKTLSDKIKIGNLIALKGVIRSGASFDPDLDMYENVIMEKCKILN